MAEMVSRYTGSSASTRAKALHPVEIVHHTVYLAEPTIRLRLAVAHRAATSPCKSQKRSATLYTVS